MVKEIIIHTCEKNKKTNTVTGEILTKVIFNSGKWEIGGNTLCNPIVCYCPFCGIKLPTLEVKNE